MTPLERTAISLADADAACVVAEKAYRDASAGSSRLPLLDSLRAFEATRDACRVEYALVKADPVLAELREIEPSFQGANTTVENATLLANYACSKLLTPEQKQKATAVIAKKYNIQLLIDTKEVPFQQMATDLIRCAMLFHPLPWRIEEDWSTEVTSGDGYVIAKCAGPVAAEAIIREAERMQADVDSLDVDAFLRGEYDREEKKDE